MIVHQALELKTKAGGATGLYHYTASYGEGATFPLGYCAEGCPGHPTEEEAYAHYYAYLLDYQTRYDGNHPDMQKRCKVCSEWTPRFALLCDGAFEVVIPLCDAHCTREQVEAICPTLSSLLHYDYN